MRLLLNGLTMLKPRTGVGQYTARLAGEFERRLPPGEFAAYPPQPWRAVTQRLLPKPAAPGGQSSTGSWKTTLRNAVKRVGQAAVGLHFARYCRTYGVKLYHEPNFLPFAADVPTVITIHDLSVLLHPEWHPADRVREHTRRLERAAGNAAHLLTDTEQVRREVIAELSMNPAKVTAVHLGVSEAFRTVPPQERQSWQQRLDLPERYFLCVGTIEPRKNLLVAMKAFASLPESQRRCCPLLLAGPWGWRADAEFNFFDRIGKAAGIRHLGYVPDEALPALYSGATTMLYPSLYEGFGLPPLEAVACGTTAICSRGTAAVREVMGNNAIYCDATDTDAWRDAMQKVFDSQSSLSSAWTRSFTWARTAMQTLAVFDHVLHGTPAFRAAA